MYLVVGIVQVVWLCSLVRRIVSVVHTMQFVVKSNVHVLQYSSKLVLARHLVVMVVPYNVVMVV